MKYYEYLAFNLYILAINLKINFIVGLINFAKDTVWAKKTMNKIFSNLFDIKN